MVSNMSLTSNTTSPHQYGGLIKMGYRMVLEYGHLYPDLPMGSLVELLLRNVTSSSVNKIGDFPLASLRELADIIPTLPQSTPEITKGIIILASLVAVSTVITALRFYSRKLKSYGLHLEDWLSLCALLLVASNGTCAILLQLSSVHVWQLSINTIIMWNKTLYATEINFVFAHLFVKSTYLVFYYSLSVNRGYRITLSGIGIFILGFSIAGLFAFIFQCTPVDFWNHMATRKCVDPFWSLLVFGVLYILADIMILVMPVMAVLGLQLRMKEKIVVISIFSAMAFVCVASVLRLLSLRVWFGNPDFTYRRISHGIWANVELNMSLVISCLPALKMLLFPSAHFRRSVQAGQANCGPDSDHSGHHLAPSKSLVITQRYDVSVMESVADLDTPITLCSTKDK